MWNLLSKELRDVTRARTFWLALVVTTWLGGYSYVQAVQIYSDASRSAVGIPELSRGLSPLDGIVVPTFGTIYLTATFVFPFLAIRAISTERQTDSLKLLIQLPYSTAMILIAKLTACMAGWCIIVAPCLIALIMWTTSGGHLNAAEIGNVLLGHSLYALVIASVSLLAACVTKQQANASILAMAVTLGFWVLDFAAMGNDGLLKEISGVSLTRILREFERGVFSLASVVGPTIAAAGMIAIAGTWLHPGRSALSKRLFAASVLAATAIGVWGTTNIKVYRDVTENRRNSFHKTDELALRMLDERLRIEVYLSAEDPRFYDFDRSILGKLRRSVWDLEVDMAIERSGRVPTGVPDDRYGVIIYSLGDCSSQSRSTSEEEVLPLIFGLAGLTRQPPEPDLDKYLGYPLMVDPAPAQIVLCYALPVLIVLSWWLASRT